MHWGYHEYIGGIQCVKDIVSVLEVFSALGISWVDSVYWGM